MLIFKYNPITDIGVMIYAEYENSLKIGIYPSADIQTIRPLLTERLITSITLRHM